MRAFWLPATCAALLCVACGSDDEGSPTGASSGPSSASSGGAGGGASASTGAGAASSSASTGGEGGSGATGGGGSGGNGGGTTGDFACVGSVAWPLPMPGVITVELNVTAETIQGNNPIEGITVKACAKADTTCLAPLNTAITGANGEVSIQVPVSAAGGFDGYFDLSSDDIPPSLVFVFPPPFEDVPPGALSVPLVDNATLDLLSLLGIDLLPERGTLGIIGQDCTQASANGLSFSATTQDAMSTQIYVDGALPSQTATSTDGSGVGAIFNVVAGPATITASIEATSQVTGTIEVFTRAGAFTYATLPPTP